MNTDKHGWQLGITGSKAASFASAIATIVTAALLVSCGRSTSYRNFTSQNQSYYAQVGESCSHLLAQLPPSSTNKAKEWKIKGDDPTLPTILRNLHATRIRVIAGFMDGTNSYAGGVSIAFGVSRAGWAIVWERNDYGNGNTPWELYVSDEGGQKIVFSTKESDWQTNKPAGPTN